MTDDTTNDSWVERTSGDMHPVAAEREALLHDHAFAFHVLETQDTYFRPDPDVLALFNETPAEDIPDALRNYRSDDQSTHRAMFSMSMPFTKESGRGMVPYITTPDYLNNYAYGINLSQNQPHPPRVVRVEAHDLASGMDYHEKKLRLDNATPETALFYKTILEHHVAEHPEGSCEETAIRRIMGGPKGSEYTQSQLALLAGLSHKHFGMKEKATYGTDVYHWNEIEAMAHQDHFFDIEVPVFDTTGNLIYPVMCQLQAALVGLTHLRQGISLPVFLYHVNGPQQGECSFVGQTPEELRKSGLEALKTLGKLCGNRLTAESLCIRNRAQGQGQFNALIETVNEELGVDLTQSSLWRAEVDKQLKAHAKSRQQS